MVVPSEIANAAARGDSATVLAWLDADVWTKLIGEVRAAGGTWTAYRRQSRKGVLRLRSLVLRGRARSRRRATGAADPVIGRVLGLPNELCWHILKFWRATSDAIGEPEVI